MKDYRQRIYERYAATFKDQTSAFDRTQNERWGRAYDAYLCGWLPTDRGSAIADLACGHGGLLHFFYERGYTDLHGVDRSPDQVALARQIAPQVKEGDLMAFLREHVGAFSLITGLDIIEHFQKEEVLAFLDLCYAALKPGGRLILQTPNAASPLGGQVRYGDFTHEVCFQDDVLARLLRLCGFSEVEAREAGPVAWGYSPASTLRALLWRGVRAGIRLVNVVETGSPGSAILTRVFLISAVRS